jgi:hypothetical protein
MKKTLHWWLWILMIAAMLGACSVFARTNPDQEALQSLEEAGSDLSKPHPFDFYLYNGEQAGAALICEQLAQDGFQTRVSEGAIPGEWLCKATQTFVPDLERLADLQVELSKLAEEQGGEYDGWETVVVP